MKKVLVATVSAGLFLFLSGAIVYVVILPGWFHENMGHLVRPPEDIRLGAVVLEKVLQALGLALLVQMAPPKAGDDNRFSLLVGALIAVPFLLSLYSNYPVHLSTALVMGLESFIRLAIAARIVTFLMRPSATQANA